MLQGIILMVFGVLLNMFAQICLKLASNSSSIYDLRSLIWIAVSMIFYVGAFILTALVLRRLPLSSVGPVMAGMTFVLVAIAGWAIFKESMPTSKVIGIALIFTGVLVVFREV